MSRLWNNHGKFIIYQSAKTGYILSKVICSAYVKRYYKQYYGACHSSNINIRHFDYVKNIQEIENWVEDKGIDYYRPYLILRNPYDRAISSFFAVSPLSQEHSNGKSPFTENTYSTFYEQYTNFEQYLHLLDRIYQEVQLRVDKNMTPDLFKDIKENERDFGGMVAATTIEVLQDKFNVTHGVNVQSHVFHQAYQMFHPAKYYTVVDFNCFDNKDVYLTTQLNDLISHFNNEHDLDVPVRRIHGVKHLQNSTVENADTMSFDDLIKYKPHYSCFYQKPGLREIVDRVFADDFKLCERFGYTFQDGCE
jgi:hypothetical protein